MNSVFATFKLNLFTLSHKISGESSPLLFEALVIFTGYSDRGVVSVHTRVRVFQAAWEVIDVD